MKGALTDKRNGFFGQNLGKKIDRGMGEFILFLLFTFFAAAF